MVSGSQPLLRQPARRRSVHRTWMSARRSVPAATARPPPRGRSIEYVPGWSPRSSGSSAPSGHRRGRARAVGWSAIQFACAGARRRRPPGREQPVEPGRVQPVDEVVKSDRAAALDPGHKIQHAKGAERVAGLGFDGWPAFGPDRASRRAPGGASRRPMVAGGASVTRVGSPTDSVGIGRV